jgi:tetratricopeptide (TPR) repeat protein
MGRIVEAEEPLREAIALGREIGLTPRELVRLHYWLGEVLWWQNRAGDDLIRVGEEGLALLGDHADSVEAALMNGLIAAGYRSKGDEDTFREFIHRTAQLIQRLPYVEELRPAYILIHIAYSGDKEVEEAMKWLHTLKERATQHHDLRAVAGTHHHMGRTRNDIGDLRGAVLQHGQALELRNRIGDTKHEGWSLFHLRDVFLSLGDLQRAKEYADRALETIKMAGMRRDIGFSCCSIGLIALCQHDRGKSVDAFVKALQILREIDHRWGEAWVLYLLGRAYLARGDRVEALGRFQEAIALPWLKGEFSLTPTTALSGLEEAYEDPELFRAFCRRFREEHPQVTELPLVQWFLDPTELRSDFRLPILCLAQVISMI